MMKKSTVCMLLCLLLSCLVLLSGSGETTEWGCTTSGTGAPGDVRTFYVTSEGNASLMLRQQEGRARGVWLSWNALFGNDKEYGHYHVTVYGLNGFSTYEWSSRYVGDVFILEFPVAGVYRVVVEPYTYTELQNVIAEYFAWWEESPSWWVDETVNCRADSTLQYIIMVQHVEQETGEVLRTSQRLFNTGDDLTIEAPSIDGYEIVGATSEKIWVGSNGMPLNTDITFNYVRSVPTFLNIEARELYTDALLDAMTLSYSHGNHTIQAWTIEGYEHWGASTANVYISRDGSSNGMTLTFYYKKADSPSENVYFDRYEAYMLSSDMDYQYAAMCDLDFDGMPEVIACYSVGRWGTDCDVIDLVGDQIHTARVRIDRELELNLTSSGELCWTNVYSDAAQGWENNGVYKLVYREGGAVDRITLLDHAHFWDMTVPPEWIPAVTDKYMYDDASVTAAEYAAQLADYQSWTLLERINVFATAFPADWATAKTNYFNRGTLK